LAVQKRRAREEAKDIGAAQDKSVSDTCSCPPFDPYANVFQGKLQDIFV